MSFKLKNYLLAGSFVACSLLGYSQNRSQNKGKQSFVDSVMAESEKYSTTTHFMYEIKENSEQNFHDVNKLEKIIRNVEKQCGKKQEYSKEEVIEILKATDNAIRAIPELENLENPCNDYSNIYLAIGKKFNLPLYEVRAPLHIFIRYDAKNDGHDSSNPDNPINKGDFNWETTVSEILSDKDYKEWLNISEKSIKKGIYMKNLTKQESISTTYSQIGAFKKNNNSALKYLNKAIELDSNNVLSYQNKGIIFGWKGDYDSALKYLNKAIELDSNFTLAYFNRATTFNAKGDYDSAVKDYKKVIELE